MTRFGPLLDLTAAITVETPARARVSDLLSVEMLPISEVWHPRWAEP